MQVICEGGASGHMTHLFEDTKLTFKQLKDIFTKLFNGKIGIEEKTDGQNLAITYKDSEVKAARNKTTLENPMSISQVKKLFDGRGEIMNAFVKSMNDIATALKSLKKDELAKIFDNGKKYMAFEIIYPPTKNVIDYGDRCLIQLHGINIYNDKWEKVSEDKEAADTLFDLLKQHDALKQKTFEITNHTKLKLKDAKPGKECLKLVLDQLSQITKKVGENATINDFAHERFKNYVLNMAKKAGIKLNKDSELTDKLAGRLSKMSETIVKKSEIASYAKSEGIDPKDSKFKEFVDLIDDTKDEATQFVIQPVEDLVIYAGLLLMKNLAGYVSADPASSAKKLADELSVTIDELSNKESTLDKSKLARFKKNLAKLDQYQREVNGVEGIVFMHKGKVYKMTSTFGAINQLMGIMRY